MVALLRRGPHHGTWGRVGRPEKPLLAGQAPGLFPPFDRPVYVCSHHECGRLFYADQDAMDEDERMDWLVHPRRGLTRCPQHLTMYQLRAAGIPAQRKAYVAWMAAARQRDHERMHLDPLAMPYLLPQEVWERAFQMPYPTSESEKWTRP